MRRKGAAGRPQMVLFLLSSSVQLTQHDGASTTDAAAGTTRPFHTVNNGRNAADIDREKNENEKNFERQREREFTTTALSGGRPESPAENTRDVYRIVVVGGGGGGGCLWPWRRPRSRGRRATLTRSRDYHDKGKPEQQRPVGD